MTWSLLNEIDNDETSTAWEAAWTYLFDTALAGRTGFTVSAHPNADNKYRSFSYTAPNPVKGGTESVRHFWTRLISGSFYIYTDATYTSVPGDLGTYTSQTSTVNGLGTSNTPGKYRFWTSTENDRALLATVGKRMLFYWPGFTEWALAVRGEDVWDGTKAPKGMMWPFPFMGAGNYGAYCRGSLTQDNSNSASYYYPRWSPDSYTPMKTIHPNPTVFTDPSFWYYGNNSSPSTSSYVIAPSVGSDFAGYWPGAAYSNTAQQEAVGSPLLQGSVILDSGTGKYWFIGIGGTNYKSGAWDMGTVEPDMS